MSNTTDVTARSWLGGLAGISPAYIHVLGHAHAQVLGRDMEAAPSPSGRVKQENVSGGWLGKANTSGASQGYSTRKKR